MYCMKCGKDTTDNQVFCESCLTTMDAYPVKPDTAIQLPARHQQAAVKKPSHKKKAPSQEEQILALKKTNRRLSMIGLVLALLLGLAIGMIIYQMTRPEESTTPTNYRNYTYSPESTNAP